MVSTGYFIRIEAKPDRVAELEATLKAAIDVVREEGLAVAWFALRLGPTTFAIVDAFENEADRAAHMENNGETLRRVGEELCAGSPAIDHVDVVAALLPGT